MKPGAGKYKVYLNRYQPPNEFGDGGGYLTSLQKEDLLGEFTILASGCSASDLSSAAAENNPVSELEAEAARLKKKKADEQAAMDARLDSEESTIEEAEASPPPAAPSLHINGMDPADPVFWSSGPPTEVCYNVSSCGLQYACCLQRPVT